MRGVAVFSCCAFFVTLGGAVGCTGDIGAGGAAASDEGTGAGGSSQRTSRGVGGSGGGGLGAGGAAGAGATTGPGAVLGPRPAVCGATASPGPAPLRRLTHREYNNTVRALLGDTSDPGSSFAPEEEVLGFDNNAEGRGTTGLLAEQYVSAAEALAARAVTNLPKLLGCSATVLAATAPAAGRDACVKTWIDVFGKRALRRPLDATESARYLRVYTTGRDKWGFDKGVELALQAMLLSPHFLYRVEGNTPARAGAKTVPVQGWEMATRLAYLLWAGPPDDELARAADSGGFSTRDKVLEHARRMMADPKARAMVADFNRQWLDTAKIDQADKDPKVFRTFTIEVRSLLRKETEAFLDHVIWTGKGDLETLLLAPYSLMNAKVAAFYGVKGPATDAFEMVPLDRSQRSGLLTQAGLLAATAHADQTSPVHRGLFVRKHLLCAVPPPPPNDAEIAAPKLDSVMTTRERFARHSAEPTCASCHRLMDPVGLGFENFDGAGVWRDTENGKPIDATGELFATDVDGRFVGVTDLERKLASSRQVSECLVTQWFRYAYGREETDRDACTRAQLTDRLAAAGGNIRELALALTQTDAFLFRDVVTPAGGTP